MKYFDWKYEQWRQRALKRLDTLTLDRNDLCKKANKLRKRLSEKITTDSPDRSQQGVALTDQILNEIIMEELNRAIAEGER